jgi:hypothetical protein
MYIIEIIINKYKYENLIFFISCVKDRHEIPSNEVIRDTFQLWALDSEKTSWIIKLDYVPII